MSRPFHPLTLSILEQLKNKAESYKKLHKAICPQQPYKFFYNIMFRLESQELIKKVDDAGALMAEITEDGKKLLGRKKPVKDGVWKMVIFDIPEKQKKVRGVLRAKLKQLQFKKWQNSIWISPYALDEEIEEEMAQLAKHFFVRLIKVKDINRTDDLDKLFN
ncbi:MAG: hypothetical protein HY918_01760 [Candidatus Doudnabacteria bacterium]|nr:hypothetical protein [Candidatus Doudnabacteria bacterium]